MSRGRRYSREGQLNYTKVFAVIIAIVVIIMGIVMVKKLLAKQKDKIEEKSKDYYALFADKKWGIIDSEGNTVIEPTYQEMIIVTNKQKDVFLCTYDINEKTGEYKTKVVNKDNKDIFTEYENVQPLENYDEAGNAWYEQDLLKVEKDNKFGLINTDGKVILDLEYDKIETLKGVENSILIKKDGKIGLVNKNGTVLINPEYKKILKFGDDYKNGYITVDSDKKYGVVSSAGSKILENKYEKINSIYGENYFVIEEKDTQKLINADGKVVIEDGFDEIVQINLDGLVFKKDKKYGFMDYDKKIKIKPEYDDLKELNTGIFKAQKDKKYGIIDIDGKEKVDFKYKDINYEESAGFYVAEGKKYKSDILNSDFKVKLTGIISELNKDKGYMKLQIDDTDKFYNFKFEEKDIKDVLTTNNLFVSKKEGKYGFVDRDGNVVVDYIYEEAQEQNNHGFAAVKNNGLWGAIDKTGKEVISPKYKLDNYLVIDFIGKWHLGQDVNMNYYCEK